MFARILSLACLLYCFVCFANEATLELDENTETATNGDECMSTIADDKVYINPEQIVVTKEGILVYIPGVKAPLLGKTLSFDQKGMYVRDWRGPCGIHSRWCKRCGGCGVLLCPMNCCCYD